MNVTTTSDDRRTARGLVPAEIEATRVIAIARGMGQDAVLSAATQLLAGGLIVLEVTLDSPGALTTIASLRERHHGELFVGAGTVLSERDVRDAVGAGAQFLVAPGFAPDAVRAALDLGVPMLPGALTPTEIVNAWDAGAAAVKLFPAGDLGVGYLKSVAAPLASIPLVATGGVDDRNAAGMFAAGAYAVGVGSWLFADAKSSGIIARARAIMDISREAVAA